MISSATKLKIENLYNQFFFLRLIQDQAQISIQLTLISSNFLKISNTSQNSKNRHWEDETFLRNQTETLPSDCYGRIGRLGEAESGDGDRPWP